MNSTRSTSFAFSRHLAALCLTLGAASLAPSCGSTREQSTWRAPRSSFGAHSVLELLDVIATSNAKFEYLVDTEMHVEKGTEMAATLRAKYHKAGAPDISPREFVERYATNSDGDGAVYYVRLPDGKRQTLADWLGKHVAR